MESWIFILSFGLLPSIITVYFVAQIVPALAKGSSYVGFCVLQVASIFFFLLSFKCSLTSDTTGRMLQAHFLFSLPQPWNHPLLQGSLMLSQLLGLSAELRHIYVCKLSNVYTYIALSVFKSIYLYMNGGGELHTI